MTVIFVAENVDSHGFLLPFTLPLPYNECIYCEESDPSLEKPSGQNRHVPEWGTLAPLIPTLPLTRWLINTLFLPQL